MRNHEPNQEDSFFCSFSRDQLWVLDWPDSGFFAGFFFWKVSVSLADPKNRLVLFPIRLKTDGRWTVEAVERTGPAPDFFPLADCVEVVVEDDFVPVPNGFHNQSAAEAARPSPRTSDNVTTTIAGVVDFTVDTPLRAWNTGRFRSDHRTRGLIDR